MSTSPTTILLVVTQGTPGGAQRFVLDIAKYLVNHPEHSLRPLIASGPGDYVPSEAERLDIPHRTLAHLDRSLNPFKSLLFTQELKKLAHTERAKLIHLNSSNTLVAPRLLRLMGTRIKTVATLHGLSLLDPHHRQSDLKRSVWTSIFRFLLSACDETVYICRANYNDATALQLSPRSTLIYNGLTAPEHIPPRDEARRALEHHLGRSLAHHRVYGTIGRFAYPKNYTWLINQARTLHAADPSALIVIIGSGPERPLYEEAIKQHHLENTVILGNYISDATNILRGFDVFILPSIFEGLPYVLLEARHQGIPILASHVGGIPEIVDKKFLFEPDNEAGFMRALHHLLSTGCPPPPPLEPRFLSEAMGQSYTELYQRLISV